MQLHIGRNTTVSPTNPTLDAFVVDALGFLAAPFALAYAIFDLSNEAKQNNPTTVVARTDVDLTNDKIRTGHYAARWTVGNASLGRHMIVWYMTLTDGASEVSWSRSFEVIQHAAVLPMGQRLYATLSDIRCEGIGPMVSDLRILETIADCSQRLETWTHREFLPRYKELVIDAEPLKAVHLEETIIGIVDLGIIEPTYTYAHSSYVVYNRHVRQGLLQPDDRQSPRLEFRMADSLYGLTSLEYLTPALVGQSNFGTVTRLTNRKSPQRLTCSGVFGYTEYDGSPEGQIPRDVKRVIMMMVLRDLFPFASQDGQMFRDRIYITQMKTREQSLTYGRPGSGANKSTRVTSYTGDPNIDSLIANLCKHTRVLVV